MQPSSAAVWPLIFVLTSCATTQTAATQTAATPTHGKISSLSSVEGTPILCEHKVPEKVCTQHHPELIPQFKKVGDWCPEHDRPESQCLTCHPDLTFAALPVLPDAADLKWLSREGEDVASLDAHAVIGKVTIFDFYADWCAPCRKIDEHIYGLLQKRKDLALRKLNVVSWETALAKHHLTGVPNLPHLIVYGRDGKVAKTISGFDLAALDAAIAEASR